MKNSENKKLPKVGDTIMLLDMPNESSYRIGMKGIVRGITRDPFENDNFIVTMDWENGGGVSLLTKYDDFMIVEK